MKQQNDTFRTSEKAGIPSWLFMLMSFIIPIYGFLTYFVLKDSYTSKAKVGLFFATLGAALWVMLKLFVWTR